MKLQNASLDWSLEYCKQENHFTNIFPKPFEIEVIKANWNSIKKEILKFKFPKDWKIRESRKIFAPKHQFGFRLCTQLDPVDEIIYSAIVYEMGEDLENSRINKNRNIVFSNRFSPSNDGKLWDENYNHSKFDEKTNSIINSGDYEYIILADIADFFPRIYTHILENSLIRATGKRAHIESIKRLLKTIYQNVSYGIPVGSEISFLLAETMLDSIDRRFHHLPKGMCFLLHKMINCFFYVFFY